MVKLVQTLEMLPTCDLATQPMIQFHYAFALNRYTEAGFKLLQAYRRIHVFYSVVSPDNRMCLLFLVFFLLFIVITTFLFYLPKGIVH